MLKKISKTIAYMFVLCSFVWAQDNTYAGIEIGGKGIKVAIIKILDLQSGKFEIVKFWTHNTAVTKGISKDSMLAKADMDETAGAVVKTLEEVKTEYNVPDEHIYVVGSSGVAMAKNRFKLAETVSELTKSPEKPGVKMDFITSQKEGELVTKGGVPSSKYRDALVFDIGGGNTKGGYVSQNDAGKNQFFGIAIDLGSVTLTELVRKKAASTSFEDFAKAMKNYADKELSVEIKSMFDNKPSSREKGNIYMSGGVIWSFATLMFPGNEDYFMKFSLSDVKKFYAILLDDVRYQQLLNPNLSSLNEKKKTKAEKDLQNVKNTYVRESLLAGTTILMKSLEEIPNIESKNMYFIRQGHVAWTIAYIVDYTRKKEKQNKP